MPFGGWFDTYYATIYCPAIEAAGLTPRRADDLARPGTIVHDIWTYTQNATVVLADLTGRNPNVFYELGLAHALAKPVILLTESLDDVPFDLRALRVIIYDKNLPDWGEALQEQIARSIREISESPLESVLPAFLKVTATTSRLSVTQHEKEMIEIRQELERVRREVARIPAGYRDTPMRITPHEAEDRISFYLKQGRSIAEIVDIMHRRFAVPASWVLRRASTDTLPTSAPQPEPKSIFLADESAAGEA